MLQIRGAEKPVTTAFCRRFSLKAARHSPHPPYSRPPPRDVGSADNAGIEDRTVEFALDEELRRRILAGQRTSRFRILIKLDPAQIQALRRSLP